jgi:CRP/FNR family transcriptional regulator, cyclic AMP receptor protein
MAVETSVELLARVPLFEGLTLEQLSAVASKGKKTFFESGAPIVTEGDPGDTAYLILSGRAVTKLIDGAVIERAELGAGALIEEMAALTETVYSETITAEDRVRTLAFTRADLTEVMESDLGIAEHIADKILDRLQALAQGLRLVDAQFAAMEATLNKAMAAAA